MRACSRTRARQLTVKLPREERRHVEPPTAEHVEAVVRLLPPATGCRCSCSTRQGCESASSRRSPGATSTSRADAGASRCRERPAGRGGSHPPPCSTRPCSTRAARRPHPDRRSSRWRRPPPHRDRTRLHRRGVPASRRTTSVIGASRCCTWRDAVGTDRRGRRARRPRHDGPHYTHVVADERELDHPKLLASQHESGNAR